MNENNNELKHYGVLGMRWGVRRASKQLSKATTKEARSAAIASLNEHREKAQKKITKLDKQRVKLQKNVDKHTVKTDARVAKLDKKSAKLKKKALRTFTSEGKAQKLMSKAMELDVKSEVLRSKSNRAKQKLAKNETMTRLFNEGISNIDKTIITKGKSCLSR